MSIDTTGQLVDELAKRFHDGPLMASDQVFGSDAATAEWCRDVSRFFIQQLGDQAKVSFRKAFNFQWERNTESENPTAFRLVHPNYSAYVVIPFWVGESNDVYDPHRGIGKWNGVGNHKGKMGFETKAEAMRYCEDVIIADANMAINRALQWMDVVNAVDIVNKLPRFSQSYDGIDKDENGDLLSLEDVLQAFLPKKKET